VAASLIDAEPPALAALAAKAWATAVRGDRWDGMLAPEIVKLRELTARARAASGAPDACIQMGSDFGSPLDVPRVTFEDMTVAQALRLPTAEEGLQKAPRWIARQSELYNSVDGCCVASRWAANSVVSDYGIDAEKVHVVGFGRNLDPPPVPKDWTRPRFLFSGLDWERKNGPMLVRAFARLRQEIPSARLDLVGEVPRLDLDGVTVHGRLDRKDPSSRRLMEQLFQQATCFVMPSRYEPFGMVYVEAAAAGTPSIGTSVGGAEDAIGDGGLLVDPTDPTALLDAMRELAEPERAAAAGSAALSHSSAYTWRAVAERVVRALGVPSPTNGSLAHFL
jgi:glycosyltransferase involved in cell wall biosynthesis